MPGSDSDGRLRKRSAPGNTREPDSEIVEGSTAKYSHPLRVFPAPARFVAPPKGSAANAEHPLADKMTGEHRDFGAGKASRYLGFNVPCCKNL